MGTTTFVWDPVFDCVSHELDENNDVKAVYHNEPQQYGGVLSQRRGSTSHYHHHDALGSTRFLTDSSGNVTDTYLNDAWGNDVASTGTTVNPFKWVGKYGYYTDDTTGQVYVRARMYQPAVARWESVDPLLTITKIQYAYVNNAPCTSTDPTGMWSQLAHRPEWYEAAREDTFESLVGIVNPGLTARNRVCIRPVPAREVNNYFNTPRWVDPRQEDWEQKETTPCAVYDVSNLLPQRFRTPINRNAIAIGFDDNGYINAAKEFFGANHVTTEDKIFQNLRVAAKGGERPIFRQHIIGHSWKKENLIGGGVNFELGRIIPWQLEHIDGLRDSSIYSWQYEVQRAAAWDLSFPCWFAVDGHVHMIGCITNNLAQHFAANVLRVDATAYGSRVPTFAVGGQMGFGIDNNGTAQFDPQSPLYDTPGNYILDERWIKWRGKN